MNRNKKILFNVELVLFDEAPDELLCSKSEFISMLYEMLDDAFNNKEVKRITCELIEKEGVKFKGEQE